MGDLKSNDFTKRSRFIKITKFVSLTILLITAISLLTGCSVLWYDADFYDQAGAWIKPEFAENHKVWLAKDPHKLTFIIDTLEEYDEIFIGSIEELDVDFDKEMLIVHTFNDESKNEEWISRVSIKDKTLKISHKYKGKYNVGDSCQPYQRWYVVKINKVDIDSVEFEDTTYKFYKKYRDFIWNISGMQ